jgi:hypothetical protein
MTPSNITPDEAESVIGVTQMVLDFQMHAWADAGAPDRLLERLAQAGPDLEQFMTMFGEAMETDVDAAVRRAGRFIRDQVASSPEPESRKNEDGEGSS